MESSYMIILIAIKESACKMFKIFKRYVLSKEEYNKLQHEDKYVEELKSTIKDTEIEKERLSLERKYKKFIGEYYQSENGVIYKIERVRYKSSSWSWNKFCFEASVPNWEDWIDVDFDEIEDKTAQHIPKNKIGEYLLR